jgi:hypothetical protein
MVDLNGHQAGNGGYKPKKAYSSPGLLYSERHPAEFEVIQKLRHAAKPAGKNPKEFAGVGRVHRSVAVLRMTTMNGQGCKPMHPME